MKTFDALSETLGLPPLEITKELPVVIQPDPELEQDTQDIEADYEKARRTLSNLIDKGDDALDHMIEIAKATEHPRGFEVVSTLMKTVADTANDLMKLQKQMQEVKKPIQSQNTPQSIGQQNNIVFQGSTAELLKHIKDNRVIENGEC